MLKKRVLSCLLLSALIFSCNKGNQGVSDNTVDNKEDTVVDNSVSEPESITEAVNVYPGLSYFKEPNAGYIGELNTGEVVSYTGITKEDKKGREFYQIITSENETVWALKAYIILDSKPAVIKTTEDITLFNKNNDNSLSDMDINPFRVVAVDTKLVDDTFSKISWHEKNTYNVRIGKYVLSEEVSFNKQDILFAKIITQYLNETNSDVKDELLVNAKSLTNICAEYRNYLNKLDMDDSMPKVPAVNSVNLKYESSFTLSGASDSLKLEEQSAALELMEDFNFDLLDYLIVSSEYSNKRLNIYILNSSKYNFTTIPAEIEFVSGDNSFYLGVIGGVSVPSGESITVSLAGSLPEEILKNDNYKIKLNFINSKVISTGNANFNVGEM